MGVVCRAEDTKLRRQAALKVLLPDLVVDPDIPELSAIPSPATRRWAYNIRRCCNGNSPHW